MNADTFLGFCLVIGFLIFALPAYEKWHLRRMANASIGIERICRKADLVARELRFDIISYIKNSDGTRAIKLNFSFEHGMHGIKGNGWMHIGTVEIYTNRDNRAIEDEIVQRIANARARNS